MLLAIAGCKGGGGSSSSANLEYTRESISLQSDSLISTEPYSAALAEANNPSAPAPVPEPGTMALLSIGLAGYALIKLRNRK